jgi:hypothetical protein
MPPTLAWGFSDVHSGAGGSNFFVDRLGHMKKETNPAYWLLIVANEGIIGPGQT